MKDKQKKELAISKVLLVALALIGILFVVWYAWIRPEETTTIDSFEECKAAGYPIMLSYPEQCAVPGGKTYTNTKRLEQ